MYNEDLYQNFVVVCQKAPELRNYTAVHIFVEVINIVQIHEFRRRQEPLALVIVLSHLCPVPPQSTSSIFLLIE